MQALNLCKWTSELHSAVPKLPTTATDCCLNFLLDGFLLLLLDEPNQLLHMRESFVLYVNKISNVKCGLHFNNYWMRNARLRVPQIEFKTAKCHAKTGINWMKNQQIFTKIRIKSFLEAFWSGMVAVLGVRKLQENQQLGSWLALGPGWASLWSLAAVRKPFKSALEEALDAYCVKRRFWKDVLNKITTFGGSLHPQNVPETTHNACFDL